MNRAPTVVTAGTARRLGLRKPAFVHPTVESGRAPAAAADFQVSIIVPTRNEAGNIAELVRRLDAALGAISAEVLFVDDSDDETPAVILHEAAHSVRPLRLVHRPPGERDGRLGGAVVQGFRLARAPWALVIDGDLQHPPEAVPQLVRAAADNAVDLVYGSRYSGSGDASGLSGRTRAWVSTFSTTLAKAAFPRRLRGITDPMSGFFAVRLAALDLQTLRPPGYKVLMEILAVSRLRGTVGVPFSFQPRFSGDSKASVAEGVRYLEQLLALRLGTSVGRLTQLTWFLAVGLSGVAVNTAALWLLTAHTWHQPYLLASLLATNVAILWNFLLLELFVFRRRGRSRRWKALSRFWLLNIALLPVQLGLLALFVEVLAQSPVVANVVSLAVVFVIRYLATTLWVYERTPAEIRAREPISLLAQARWLRRSQSVTVLGRFGLAVAATALAFPAVLRQSWSLVTGGGLPAVELVAGCAAAVALVAVRAVPSPGDPDVHDRQVDFILALPAFAAALFLSYAWPNHLGLAGPLGSREVLGVATFLAGASLLMLGTRCTARLRRVLYLPLLMLPEFRAMPLVTGAVIAVLALSTAVPVVRGAGRRAGVRNAADPAASPPRQTLPQWQPAVLGVTVVAAVMALLAVSARPAVPAAPAPAAAAGTHR